MGILEKVKKCSAIHAEADRQDQAKLWAEFRQLLECGDAISDKEAVHLMQLCERLNFSDKHLAFFVRLLAEEKRITGLITESIPKANARLAEIANEIPAAAEALRLATEKARALDYEAEGCSRMVMGAALQAAELVNLRRALPLFFQSLPPAVEKAAEGTTGAIPQDLARAAHELGINSR